MVLPLDGVGSGTGHDHVQDVLVPEHMTGVAIAHFYRGTGESDERGVR